MQEELKHIGAVPEMNEEEFRTWVAATINQTPLVGRVIQRIDKEGQVTEAVLSDLLAEIGVDATEYRAREVLEVLERWLTYFLPMEYETAGTRLSSSKLKSYSRYPFHFIASSPLGVWQAT